MPVTQEKMNSYPIGQRVRVFARPFEDEVTRQPYDPSTVTLKVGTTPGDEVTYTYGVGATIVKDSKGVYHADISTVSFVPGIYTAQWRSPDEVAGQTQFKMYSSTLGDT